MLRRFVLLVGLVAGLLGAGTRVRAICQAPPQVQELLRLLDDPVIRDWVAAQKRPLRRRRPRWI